MRTRPWWFIAVGLLVALAAIAFNLTDSRPASAQLALPTATPTPAPPGAPLPLAPANGALTTGVTSSPLGMPTFSWKMPASATIAHIQVSSSPGFSDLLVDTDTYGDSYTPTVVWVDGTYYWRVRAGLGSLFNTVWGPYSDTLNFTKRWSDGTTAIPKLVAPAESAPPAPPAVLRNVDFTWTAVDGAAGYTLEIGRDDTFADIVYKADTVKPQHAPTERLVGNTYAWRVRPFAEYNYYGLVKRIYGATSLPGHFTIDWSTPPQLLNPANNYVASFVPRFQWQAVEGAKTYLLQVSTDPGFGGSTCTSSCTAFATASTDFTPTDTFPNDKDYYWRVRGQDAKGNPTNWSEVRLFRMQWSLKPTLLTPLNNEIKLSYPFFSWKPVPGAEKYEIQIDDTKQFDIPLIGDAFLYNVTSYTQPDWRDVPLTQDFYWRVRAQNAAGSFTPWSEIWSFRSYWSVAPNLIYPPHTYDADTTNTPVSKVTSIAWPVFVWDTAHEWQTGSAFQGITLGPDLYWLEVDDSQDFSSPNLSIQTRTLGAAPVYDISGNLANGGWTFTGLQNGTLYYWRVRAFRAGHPLGETKYWQMRYDRSNSELPVSTVISPTVPRDGFEAVGTPPVLGWLPVVYGTGSTDAHNYHVQISRTSDFSAIVDEAYPQFVNYVPWQGKPTEMPFGTYWWRVRAESSPGAALTDWSEARHFNLSTDLVNGNYYDLPLPLYPQSVRTPGANPALYDPNLSLISAVAPTGSDEFQLNELHIMLDRSYTIPVASLYNNLNWVIAFNINPSPGKPVRYGIYVDNNHLQGLVKNCSNLGPGEDDPGAPTPPPGQQPVSVKPLYLPEYAIYVDWDGSQIIGTTYYRWNGIKWNPQCSWAAGLGIQQIGGFAWYDPATKTIELLVPYTALGTEDKDFSGSLAVTVFSVNRDIPDGIHQSVPPQGLLPGSNPQQIDNPAFVSDMLMPLYPFDTPLSDPTVFKDMPAVRWRMPVFDSVDGYQVQIARDERFSQVLDEWSTYETYQNSIFSMIPASFQSGLANADNESYYWRVRLRHEQIAPSNYNYDNSAWSPPMRFKLDSRRPGNPRLSTGPNAFMTPTFEWDRVEGAAGYILQVDDDPKFGSPLVNVAVDDTSYTMPEAAFFDPAMQSQTPYYWRVAIRRSDNVFGQWTDPILFTKTSVAPTPLSPVTTSPLTVVGEQPTFSWTPILAPAGQPRLAVAQYFLQVDDDPNFTTPKIQVVTANTSYTPVYAPLLRENLGDGTWYWRVAIMEATGKHGPFSPTQQFLKQYPLTTMVSATGGGESRNPQFVWQAVPGAAFYRFSLSNNDAFQNGIVVDTLGTSYTPVAELKYGQYFWRVQMYDVDGMAGPITSGKFNLGYSLYLPNLAKK